VAFTFTSLPFDIGDGEGLLIHIAGFKTYMQLGLPLILFYFFCLINKLLVYVVITKHIHMLLSYLFTSFFFEGLNQRIYQVTIWAAFNRIFRSILHPYISK
jgi:hypothetical protein